MSPSPIPLPSPAAGKTPSPPPQSSPSATPTNDDKDGLKCQWEGCSLVAPDGDQLYLHLCNNHIGRKSTNNLCLTCKWANCNTSCSKRDHITSHLRVHIPLKPHNCQVCDKSFKRPQDLKKHEKIHTEEHHAQHKHSKAVTVADPAFNSRVRAQQQPKVPAYSQHLSAVRSSHHPHSRSPSTADEARTPADGRISSPLVHHADNGGLPLGSWDYANLLASRDPSTHRSAAKRSFDLTDSGAAGAAVDGFFRDMKKRRYATTYDAQMIESLSALSSMAFAGHQMAAATLGANARQDFSAGNKSNGFSSVNMNPLLAQGQIDAANAAATLALSSLPSQALPASPEELAIVNQFLVRLGEEIAAGNVPQPPPHLGAVGGGGYGLGPTGSLNRPVATPQTTPFTNQNYFDANTLAALGIANVPGITSGYLSGAAGQTPASLYNNGHGARDPASLSAALNLGTTTAMASAHLYTHAAALAGLSSHHPANALSQLPSSVFASQQQQQQAQQQAMGKSASSASSEMERTLRGASVSPTENQYPHHQHSLSTLLGSAASDHSPSSPSAQSSSRSSAGAPSPMPGYVQPTAGGGAETFPGVPTTRETRTGISVAPQILPMDSKPGPSVRKPSVMLQAAPPTGDEEVDELAEDEEIDGTALAPPRPASASPALSSRTLSPSSKVAYPSISRLSSPSPPPSQVTLPSAASLISTAEALEDSRAAAAVALGHRRYPSEESESTQRSRRSSTPSSGSRGKAAGGGGGKLYPSLDGDSPTPTQQEVVLPGIASLVLDIPSQEQRVKHIELIKAMLVWVNTEYVKKHGDPWAQAAAAASTTTTTTKSASPAPPVAASPRVGMLKKVEEMMDVDSDGEEDEDSDESLESEDELSLTPVASFSPRKDVEMVVA